MLSASSSLHEPKVKSRLNTPFGSSPNTYWPYIVLTASQLRLMCEAAAWASRHTRCSGLSRARPRAAACAAGRRGHFAALPDMARNFFTVSGAAVTGKKSGAPMLLGTFRAGADPKLAKVELSLGVVTRRGLRRRDAGSGSISAQRVCGGIPVRLSGGRSGRSCPVSAQSRRPGHQPRAGRRPDRTHATGHHAVFPDAAARRPRGGAHLR